MLPIALSGYAVLAIRVALLAAVQPLMKAMSRRASSVVATSLFCIVGAILVSPLVIWQVVFDPASLSTVPQWYFYSLASASAFTFGMIAYMWALKRGDINLLAPLSSLSFILLYALDAILLRITVSWVPIFGILLVTLGVTLLNLTPGTRLSFVLNPLNVIRHPGAGGALFFALMLAVSRVVDSQIADIAPPVIYAAVGNVNVVILCLLVLAARRNMGEVRQFWQERKLLTVSAGAVGMVGYIVLLICYDYFVPSVIEPVSQIAIVAAVLLGTWIYKEPLYWRWLAAIFVAGGAALVLYFR